MYTTTKTNTGKRIPILIVTQRQIEANPNILHHFFGVAQNQANDNQNTNSEVGDNQITNNKVHESQTDNTPESDNNDKK